MNTKPLSSLILMALCVCILPSLFATNEPPCCQTETCTGKARCACAWFTPPDDCYCSSSGTGSGSIEFSVSFPGVATGNELRNSQLYFHHETPSLTMFTPQGLDYISPAGAYISSIEGDFSDNEPITLIVSNRRGIPIAFKVPDNDWVGYALDAQTAKVFRLEMLDEDLIPVMDEEPAFVRLVHSGEGSSILLDFSTGEAIEETDPLGRVTRFDKVNIIREDGVIVQIDSPGGLIDFEVIDPDFEYEIRLYPKDTYTFNASSGAYELNEGVDPILEAYKRFNIKNPAYDRQDIDEVRITRYWDDRTTQWQFQYYTNNDLWELRTGEVVDGNFTLLQREESRLVKSQDETRRTDIKIIYDADDKLLSEVIEKYELVGGSFELARKVEDPDGANRVTEYGYYATGDARGKLKYQINPDDSWEAYSYDSDGRITLKVESWLDVPYDDALDISSLASLAKSTEYSYAPLDSRDYGISQPDKARTETVRVLGIITGRTWRAYLDENDGYHHEITERAVSQTAEYGDASNLRSENIYYPRTSWGQPEVSARRLQSSLSEDGTLITYDYSKDAAGQFIVTETHAHADAPEGMAFRSMQYKKTYDALANLLREEQLVFSSDAYESLYYMTHAYDANRKRLQSRRFDGPEEGRITYTATYSHGKATSVTDEEGKTVNTIYDVLDRKEMEITEGSEIAGVDDIIKSYGYSTSATGCGCSAALVTTQSADGMLTLKEVNETDRVERTTKTVDVNGLKTTYAYSDGGRAITVNLPNNATRITTSYRDGRIKSITGSAVVPQYHTYGVHADGTTWMRVDTVNNKYHEVEDIASVKNLRFTKTTMDMAGRLVRETSPSFDKTEVSTTYAYDNYNRLIAQSQTDMADTLYEYDAMGNLLLSGLDMNQNGQLNLVSGDRITDHDQFYQLSEGVWYYINITKVYPIMNNSTETTVWTSKRQLSGFSENLVAREITLDIHGNQTTRSIEIDRANKTVTQTTDTPFSSTDAQRVLVNGLLVSQNTDTVAAATTYAYDNLGRLVSVKDPRHTNRSEIEYYTGKNQIFSRTDANGNTTAYTYCPNGKIGAGEILSTTNALGQKTYFAYSRLGLLMRTWGQTDYPQKYTHNKYAELTSLTTWRDTEDSYNFAAGNWPKAAGGDKTSWIYDISTGLLKRKRYADGTKVRYAYNKANRLTRRTWAREGDGLHTIYSYSKKTGELTAVNYEDPGTVDITYKYDRLGRQTEITDATGTRTFSYDSGTLQLTSETLDATFYKDHKLARSYDAQGRSIGYTLQNSAASALSAVNYSYDSQGRLSTVSDSDDTFTYEYAADSNLLALITAPKHSVNYTYEANRDLMTIIDNQVSGASVSKYTYAYDSLGRRSHRVQSGSAITRTSTDSFSYNSRSEVIGSSNSVTAAAEWNPTYAYDKIGNRQSSAGVFETNYTTNSLNQYSTIAAPSVVNPTYDLDGNLTSDGGNWTYTWNNENRLESASGDTTTLRFTYDYMDRMVKKEEGSDVEVYLYDGWNRITTFNIQDSTLSVQDSCLWGLDLSGTLQGAGGVGGLLKEGDLYPTFDANGNVMQKLDSEGKVVMSVTYDPFGSIIDGELTGEYGFSTKPLIDDLNWYYYGFRYYDPVTGRWPNRDPIFELGHLELKAASVEFEEQLYNEFLEGELLESFIELNRYGFVFNSPLNYIDINGENPAAARTIAKIIIKQLKKFLKKKKKKKKGKCKPCSPKKGTKLCEFVSAGSRQRGAHKNSCEPHCKIWTVLQAPYPNCGCFWSKPSTIENCKGCPPGSRSGGPPRSSKVPGGGPKK